MKSQQIPPKDANSLLQPSRMHLPNANLYEEGILLHTPSNNRKKKSQTVITMMKKRKYSLNVEFFF